MDPTGLILATGLMGLAGLPHCAAMCAAPCAAVLRAGGPSASPAFHLARVAGYAAAGAVAAASVQALQQALVVVPFLRPLWTLLHLAALALGLWMLATGRIPPWPGGAPTSRVKTMNSPLRATLAGGAWIAWPCALSQSALLVAALADRPWIGGAAMASFAIASAPGLVMGPLLLRRLAAPAGALIGGAWAVRGAGLVLGLGSAWALGHGLWIKVVAWCAS
jgi:hypothetical protein